MAAITPQMVKELRDKTDAGMGECKKALIEANGDIEAAVDILRKAGIAKSAHRADRATAEGKIFVAVDGNQALMLEVCCETDFVANNEKFLEYGNGAAKKILANTTGDGDVTEAAQKSEETELAALFSKFGEKMIIRRALRYTTDQKIAYYIHFNGKIGVLLDIGGEIDEAGIKNTCLQICASSPQYVNSSEVPAEAIAHEKEIATAQLKESGKPENIIEKIVAGKINSWYGEICLVNQPWILDNKTTFGKLFPKATVKRFARWAVGQ
ncbi:MAG: elongation factor Ts [Lentisphaeria bacterium]|nr:elongation factor Ts [Lentisphaeria bacterium]